jgi:hypothetical protein
MNANRDAKVQQILELFKAGDYLVDPTAVARSVIRRTSVPRGIETPASDAAAPGLPSGQVRRIRGIVAVDRGHARVAAF